MTELDERFIETVDAWGLHDIHWPIMRELARKFVEQHEIEHYERALLRSGTWRSVRLAPHWTGKEFSDHIFDVYGTPYLS